MAQIAYVDWDGLVYYDGKVKKYVADKLEPTLKDGGRIAFNQLPEPSYDSLNYIYTITDDFQTDTNFQIPGRSFSSGTAVKVSEVEPATYRYTIFNEIISDADANQFAAINAELANLKTNLNEKANDILFTEDYRVSSPVGAFTADESVKDLTLANIIEKLLGLRLSVRYSLKFFVDGELYGEHFYEEGQKISPPADPVKDGYTFDGWKAGDIWITDASTMPATNVEAHATFTKTSGEPQLPENPTMPEIADFIEKTSAPVYSLGASGVITAYAFEQKVFTQATENEPPSTDANTAETFFYTVLDENDSVIEAGYQIYTVYQEEEYLTVAIPDYISNFHVERYDPDNSIWTAPTWTLKRTDAHPIDGYTTYTAADSETMSGISIRIVIDG